MCLNRRVTRLLYCIYNLNTEKLVIKTVIFGLQDTADPEQHMGEGCQPPGGSKIHV